MLKSGLLLRKFQANVGSFSDINRPETESQPPSTSDPIARSPSVKEVNDLPTGVLRRSLQLRHSDRGTKSSPAAYFILRRMSVRSPE
jgi:hypothetical protein